MRHYILWLEGGFNRRINMRSDDDNRKSLIKFTILAPCSGHFLVANRSLHSLRENMFSIEQALSLGTVRVLN